MSQSGNTEKEPTQYTVKQKAHEESWKLRYDTFKHLTTLNTGSILILVAFLEKVFTNPEWRVLVGIAFGLFLFSILAAMLSMIAIAKFVENLSLDEADKEFGPVVILLSLGSFLGGVLCLIIFTVKNFYW
jgi:hypothetical protein